MVVHAHQGKVQIRSDLMKVNGRTRGLARNIRKIEGVEDVDAKQKNGVVTFTYNPNIHPPKVMEYRVERLLSSCFPCEEKKRNIAADMGKASKIGMGITMAGMIWTGFSGDKKAHIATGSAFSAFALIHMVQYLNRLFK